MLLSKIWAKGNKMINEELKDLLDYPFYTYQKNMTLYSTIKDLFIS